MMIMATIPITTTPPTAPPAIAPTFKLLDAAVRVWVLMESEPPDTVGAGAGVVGDDSTDTAVPPLVVAAAVEAVVLGTVAACVLGLLTASVVLVPAVVCAATFRGKPAEPQYPSHADTASGTSATSPQAEETQALMKELAESAMLELQ